MKLQELIDKTDLAMTEIQVKAFFLGVLCAEKPMPYPKALEELVADAPEAKAELEAELKKLWDHLKANLKSELTSIFPQDKDVHAFMEVAKGQLDFFLTAMSLSGTNTEKCTDEELAELIEELENIVEDMDDFLSDDEASTQDGEDFKEFLIETWNEFVSNKN